LSRAGRLLPKLLDLGVAKLVTRAAVTGAPGGAAYRDASRADLDAALSATLDGRSGATSAHVGAIDSHAAAQVTRAGAFIGSPYYMAPEQWVEGEAIDARADQYALGVVAFEMIAGALPFTGESIQVIARAHLNAAVPELPDGAPRALGDALARALAKHPG